MEVQRVAAVIRSVSKELKRTMRKDKLPSEEELIALVQAGEEEKALAVLGSTQYAIKFKTRHKALKRALRDLVRLQQGAGVCSVTESVSNTGTYVRN